ncbi:MAG: transketolase family protein [Prevotella sp.]
MRTAFINQLVEEAKYNDRIFLLVGDLGYNVVEPFANSYPDRFLNIGIAEQNMAGIAAGLAMNGFIVYCYSIGNFPTLRCIEQVRNDIAYYNGSVRIVSVGAGYAYGTQGVSHHATEDIGMLRTIPNMVVCSPSDPTEARRITSISSHYDGTMYMRLGKAGEANIFSEAEKLRIGDIHTFRESDSENALFVSGSIMKEAVDWIMENAVDTAIYSVPFIKPISREQLKSIASRHHNIIVLEEHQLSAGLGSAIVEQLSDMYASGELTAYPKIRRIAINDIFLPVAGDQAYCRRAAGLTLRKDYFE